MLFPLHWKQYQHIIFTGRGSKGQRAACNRSMGPPNVSATPMSKFASTPMSQCTQKPVTQFASTPKGQCSPPRFATNAMPQGSSCTPATQFASTSLPQCTPSPRFAMNPQTLFSSTPNPPQGGYNCPFSQNALDSFQNEDEFGVPCSECGAVQEPPCRGQGMGMGYDTSMGMGYGYQNMMPPCIECGYSPYPPCMESGGYAQHPNTPCEECAGDQMAQCVQEQLAEPEGKAKIFNNLLI